SRVHRVIHRVRGLLVLHPPPPGPAHRGPTGPAPPWVACDRTPDRCGSATPPTPPGAPGGRGACGPSCLRRRRRSARVLRCAGRALGVEFGTQARLLEQVALGSALDLARLLDAHPGHVAQAGEILLLDDLLDRLVAGELEGIDNPLAQAAHAGHALGLAQLVRMTARLGLAGLLTLRIQAGQLDLIVD